LEADAVIPANDDPGSGAFAESEDLPVPMARQPAGVLRETAKLPVTHSPGRGLAQRLTTGLIPYLSHQAQYVGRVGVIGVALIVFSVVCFVSANSTLHQQLVQLRLNLAESQRDQLARHRAGTDVTPASQLQTFVKKLPARAELPAITQQVVLQATAAGLALERGSYDFSVTHGGQIVRARLSFPVEGSYPNIRRFIDGTLASIPGAAVDGLRLERKNIGSDDIAADIRFAVFLRNDP
jgi:hypothetical protein